MIAIIRLNRELLSSNQIIYDIRVFSQTKPSISTNTMFILLQQHLTVNFVYSNRVLPVLGYFIERCKADNDENNDIDKKGIS